MAKAALIEAPKLTIEQMRAMSYADLLSTLNPQELEAFRDIEKHQTDQLTSELWQWWERGRKLLDVKKHADNGKFYGSQVVEKFSRLLSYETPNMCYAAIRVASVWTTKEQFAKHVVNRQNGSFMLLWSHVVLIGGLSDTAVRQDWIDRTIEEQWNYQTLHAKLKEAGLISQSNNPRGRSVALPASVPDALQNIRAMSTALVRKTDDAWMSDNFNIIDEIDRLPAQVVTPQLYDDTEKTLADLISLGDKVTNLINAVAAGRDKLRQRIEANGQQVPSLSNGSSAVVEGTVTNANGSTPAATPSQETTMATAKKTAKKKAAPKPAKKKAAKKKS